MGRQKYTLFSFDILTIFLIWKFLAEVYSLGAHSHVHYKKLLQNSFILLLKKGMEQGCLGSPWLSNPWNRAFIQGQSSQTAIFELALTDTNMQVRFYFKRVFEILRSGKFCAPSIGSLFIAICSVYLNDLFAIVYTLITVLVLIVNDDINCLCTLDIINAAHSKVNGTWVASK